MPVCATGLCTYDGRSAATHRTGACGKGAKDCRWSRGGKPASPVTLFYSYAHADEDLRRELEKQLAVLRRGGLIAEWHDRKIDPGDDWKGEIDHYLMTADIESHGERLSRSYYEAMSEGWESEARFLDEERAVIRTLVDEVRGA